MRLCLVAMPWQSLDLPSLQLSLLSEAVRAARPNDVVDTYYGKHLYRIDTKADPFRILSKRSVLGMDMLYPGKLTIII